MGLNPAVLSPEGRARRTTAYTLWIALSGHYSWLLSLLCQHWLWAGCTLNRATSRSTTRTAVTTKTEMTAKSAPTGDTWQKSTGVIPSTKGSTTKCSARDLSLRDVRTAPSWSG